MICGCHQRLPGSLSLLVCGITHFIKFARLTVGILDWFTNILVFSGCSTVKSCLTLTIPWTVAHRAPLSMGFPRQEYWSGLPFPSPGDLPNPGTELTSPTLAGGFFTTEPPAMPGPGMSGHHFYALKQLPNVCTN